MPHHGYGTIGFYLSNVRVLNNSSHDNGQGGFYIADSPKANAVVKGNHSFRNATGRGHRAVQSETQRTALFATTCWRTTASGFWSPEARVGRPRTGRSSTTRAGQHGALPGVGGPSHAAVRPRHRRDRRPAGAGGRQPHHTKPAHGRHGQSPAGSLSRRRSRSAAPTLSGTSCAPTERRTTSRRTSSTTEAAAATASKATTARRRCQTDSAAERRRRLM
jgi:hypothetical protein